MGNKKIKSQKKKKRMEPRAMCVTSEEPRRVRFHCRFSTSHLSYKCSSEIPQGLGDKNKIEVRESVGIKD